MLEYYFYGGGLRLAQVVIYASLWLVIGFFVAAIFRSMLGPAKVRKLFGEGSRRGIFTGWLIGMLLPVCSLGVIPILRELYRSGVKGGTIIAFGLTAPLFNPLSVLYGLTLSDPIAILSFSLCALAIVSVLGVLWDRCFPTAIANVDAEQKVPTPGIKRAVAVFRSAALDVTSMTSIFIVIGIFGSVLVAVSFQKGYLQGEVERDNVLAPVTVAAIALPIYSTPLLAMSQIGGMFQHGNSVGAAFSLLILGAGANLGIVAWFCMNYGWRRALLFLALLATVTIGLAYAIDKPLYPKGVEPAGHSHAFDVYTHPFHYDERNLKHFTQVRLAEIWRANESGGTFLLGGMVLLGVFVRLTGKNQIEKWIYAPAPDRDRKFDVEVPGWVVGGTAVGGLVMASIAGCYLYYPAPGQLLPDMLIINNECVLSAKTKEWEAAEKWIPYADDLSRRLEVGVFLRHGNVSEYKTEKAKVYRDKLDNLKQAVKQQDVENIEEMAMAVHESYRRLSRAFRDAVVN